MASSQVQISSSPPFGCVLRDHNRRDHFRDPNARATHLAFHNNLKTFVMDRLNDCASISSNENSENHNINVPNFRVPNTSHTFNDDANALDPSSLISPRRSSLLDRWATKQLHETLSTIDQQNPDIQPLTHTTSRIDSSIASPPTKAEPPPPPPRAGSNAETSKLGASSLVQIWEKRLSHSNSFNSNSNLNQNSNAMASSSRQVPELVNMESTCSVETRDFEDERYDAGPGSEDPFADWHSNRTSSCSPPCSTQSQSSDAGESERVRVADIIRRLAARNQSHSLQASWIDENENSNESSCPSVREQVEHRCFSQVINSPRIRGRQAFADLLMQMERDRQRELDRLVERRAVSKFGQRGRIQSLLRLRILKRGMAVEDQQRPQYMPSRGSRSLLQGSSTIMHLRERFTRVGEKEAAAQNGASNPRSPPGPGEIVNNDKILPDSNGTYSSSVSSECSYNGESGVQSVMHCSIDTVVDPIPGDVKVEGEGEEEAAAPATSHAIWQDIPNLNLQDSSASVNGWDEDEVVQEHDADYDQPCVGTSYDWFTDISRPRSYWEDLRQTWYQEMLDSNSDKDEIRQLIKRKTVSSFLSSDFRERMDRLLVSRLERQTEEPEGSVQNKNEDGGEKSWYFSERDGERESSDDEEEEEASSISAQYHEASDFMDQCASSLQLASPSIMSSWSYQHNDRAATSTSKRVPSQSSGGENQECSLMSRNHASIEMELIYDLRGQMEQLYQEMSELRKSLKCCMDMQQLMLQGSVEPVAGAGRKRRARREGKCCICYEMQVDSLLYRCGHMCSCMECGQELLWKGGKCPICGSPIDDVVRAHAHH